MESVAFLGVGLVLLFYGVLNVIGHLFYSNFQMNLLEFGVITIIVGAAVAGVGVVVV